MSAQYIELNITITPNFWFELVQKIHKSTTKEYLNNLLVIVPTANHIKIFEQAWLNYYNYQYVQLPRIVTLEYILEEYNLSYKRYNPWAQYLNLYQFFKQNSHILSNFNEKNPTQKWEYVKTLADICNELSEKYLYQIPLALDMNINFNDIQNQLEQAVEQEYKNISSSIAQFELQLILQVWQHTININHMPFYTWQSCINFAKLNTYNLLYVAFDKEDKNLWYIKQNYNFNKYKLIITNILWDTHQLKEIFPEANNINNPYFNYSNIQPNKTTQHIQEINLQNLEIVQAQNLADVAQYILLGILQSFKQGKNEIALIAQDRIAIRRIKSLLQNYNIPIVDETGWKISTTLISSCIKQWLNILQSNIFNVYCIEFAIKNLNLNIEIIVLEELKTYHNKNINELPINNFTNELKQQIKLWHIKQTLDEWQKTWYTWCKWLNFDLLEHQINNICSHINQVCLADNINIYTLNEFILFIQSILEQANIASLYDIAKQKVHIIALNGSRLRIFDHVYFIGCDNKQFPSSQEHSLLLNENMRYSLGLESKAIRFAHQARDLLQLIYAHKNSYIEFIYQAYDNQNEQQDLSCWIIKLHKYNNIKYTSALEKIENYLPLAANITHINCTDIKDKNLSITESSTITITIKQNEPNIILNKNLQNLSVSSIVALYTCPYQFYLRQIAKLNKPYNIKGKNSANYGLWIHEILYIYHSQYIYSTVKTCISDLLHISQTYLENLIINDAYAMEAYITWKQQIPAYAKWQQSRYDEGYEWAYGELAVQKMLETVYPISLHARLDRIDINHKEKIIQIIDYKWKKKIDDENQSIQLFLYQNLYKAIMDTQKLKDYQIQSYFLPLKEAKITLQSANIDKNFVESLSQMPYIVMQDLTINLSQYQNGKEFNAQNGVHCKYCDYYYMCIYKDNVNDSDNLDIDEE